MVKTKHIQSLTIELEDLGMLYVRDNKYETGSITLTKAEASMLIDFLHLFINDKLEGVEIDKW